MLPPNITPSGPDDAAKNENGAPLEQGAHSSPSEERPQVRDKHFITEHAGLRVGIMSTSDGRWKRRWPQISEALSLALAKIDNAELLNSFSVIDFHPHYSATLIDKYGNTLYLFEFNIGKVLELGTIRALAPEPMVKNEKGESLRPRWAEEARPKKQIKLRLGPDLISRVERAAATDELNRNDWIERAIEKALKPE